MARKNQVKQLLGETDPLNLQQLAVGSFLAVFIFAGAFLVTDTAMYLTTAQSTLTAAVYSFDISDALCAAAIGC